MKTFKMFPAALLLAACASNTQPAAQTSTTPVQPAVAQSGTGVVDPVGAYEFSTAVDGQTVTGTVHIEGTTGAYKGKIVTSVFPEIPIVGATVENNVIIARGSMPDGELTFRMVMEGANFKGNWSLGGNSGELAGKKLPR
jgi:hypothetical protein